MSTHQEVRRRCLHGGRGRGGHSGGCGHGGWGQERLSVEGVLIVAGRALATICRWPPSCGRQSSGPLGYRRCACRPRCFPGRLLGSERNHDRMVAVRGREITSPTQPSCGVEVTAVEEWTPQVTVSDLKQVLRQSLAVA